MMCLFFCFVLFYFILIEKQNKACQVLTSPPQKKKKMVKIKTKQNLSGPDKKQANKKNKTKTKKKILFQTGLCLRNHTHRM